MTNKPTIPEVVERFVAYFEKPGNGCWGSLHAVLDDGNVGDGDVDFAIQWATDKGDAEGLGLALLLRRMSKTQRGKIDAVVQRLLRARKGAA